MSETFYFTWRELKDMFDFAEKHRHPGETEKYNITLEISERSGIGTSKLIKIQHNRETEGVFKDVTDYNVW